ncbi:hypothetical protein GCM10009563_05060 [Subtercola frigoramans]
MPGSAPTPDSASSLEPDATDAVAETSLPTDVAAETHSDPDAAAHASEPKTEVTPEAAPEDEVAPEAEAAPESDAEAGAEAEVNADADAEPEAEEVTEAETEPDADAEPAESTMPAKAAKATEPVEPAGPLRSLVVPEPWYPAGARPKIVPVAPPAPHIVPPRAPQQSLQAQRPMQRQPQPATQLPTQPPTQSPASPPPPPREWVTGAPIVPVTVAATGFGSMTPMDTSGERRVAVIIEDDADIRHLLETVLTQAGFETVATGNGLDGVQAVRAYSPIITTLDVSMPGIDGFEAAKRIRAFSNTYLIMLTARDDEIDTLQGLEAGADDYLTKPFRPRELRARIEAMQRRPRAMVGDEASQAAAQAAPPVGAPQTFAPAPNLTQPSQPVYAPAAESPAPNYGQPPAQTPPAYAQPTQAPQPDYGQQPPAAAPYYEQQAPAEQQYGQQQQYVQPYGQQPAPSADPDGAAHTSYPSDDGWVEYNGLYVNEEMRLAEKDGAVVELTRSEFDLLNALMSSQRRVRSKADLALLLRGESYVTAHFVSESDKRAIEVHMANLRRKLSDSLTNPRFIETVRGIGYRLAASEND